MAWVERVEKRSQKGKHFFDSETGLWRAEFGISDLHYHDGSQWQDIDESLVDDGLDGYNKKCDKTRHIFRIAQGGARRWYPRRNVTTEYVDITNLQYFQGTWRNLNLPAVVWKSNGAEWDMPNIYASVTNTWRRIKTDFILKDATAPTGLRFEVSFVGLTLDGNWKLTSTTDSEIVGSIDPPIAFDANETDVPISAVYSGGYIEWSVNTAGATFPVYVDPTFTDGPSGNIDTAYDDMVDNANPTYNYGTRTSIGESVYNHKGLVLFDLSSIPGTATCNSATLYLYKQNTVQANQPSSIPIRSIASGNAGWTEGARDWTLAAAGEPCWNAKEADGSGGVTTAWAGSAGLSTSGTDYETTDLGSYNLNGADAQYTEYTCSLLTSRIEDWFGLINTNYGIIHDHLNASAVTSVKITSSNFTTPGYRPKLVVTYTLDTTGPIVSEAHGHDDTESTSKVVNLPDGCNVTGRRIILIFTSDGSSETFTEPDASWIRVVSETGSGFTTAVFYHDTDGTEGYSGTGDTETFTISSVEQAAWSSYLIKAGEFDSGTAPQASTPASGTSTAPDPGSLTPSWGSANNIWFTYCVGNGADFLAPRVTGVPTNYTTNAVESRSPGPNGITTGVSWRQTTATSEDPSAFTLDTSVTWTAVTIAVKPAAGDTLSVNDAYTTTYVDAISVTSVTMTSLRPSADVIDGQWTNELGSNVDLHQSVDEAVASDTDWIQSEWNPSSSVCVLKLQSGTDPEVSYGHKVRYRYDKDPDTSESVNFTFQLRQGYVNEGSQGTLIAEWTHSNISGTLGTVEQDLTPTQTDNITDYTDLYVRMVAG